MSLVPQSSAPAEPASEEDNFVKLVGEALHDYRPDNPDPLAALLASDVVYQMTPLEHPDAGTYEGPEEFLAVFARLIGPGGIRDAQVVPGSPVAVVTTVLAYIHAVDQVGEQADVVRFEFNPEGKVVLVYHVHRSPAA